VIVTGAVPPPVTGVKIGAVGDAACPPAYAPTSSTCRQMAVSDRIVADTSLSWLLVLGDLQYENGELANFQTAYEASYGRLKAKTKPVPGNHEYNTNGAQGYFTYFGAAAGDPNRGFYSFDVGDTWHIVALNSNCGVVTCAAGSAQEQWLRADLAASARPCTLAFWHHPRFSSAGHGDNISVLPFWNALSDAGAEVVLSGHDHSYERFDPQTPTGAASATGLREFVVGTGGRSLYPFGPAHANSALRISTFGYLRLTLGAEAYSWQFVSESGAVIDSGTGACH
jgi:3',5'-cyclic AMP phosphodiesterase CpdA